MSASPTTTTLYTVSILDDGAGQGTFDTSAAESEVAFISSDASYGTVGSKLRTHPRHVVDRR